MKVVILGKGEMLSNLIEGTLSAECEIVGVFRYERTIIPAFLLKLRDFFKTSYDVTLIKEKKLPEIKCKSANSEEFKNILIKSNADVLLVGTWHEKLKKEIIDVPVIASVNVHPSFLPSYRGPNPYLQCILHQEKTSGITFHLMNENFDEGSILAQKTIDILPNDTSKELKERTVYQARLMCQEILTKLNDGLIIPIPQNNKKATYFKNIRPIDMMLDFEKETVEQIDARIRALHPWLPCYVTYKSKYFIPNPYKLKILDAEYTQKILEKNEIKKPKVGQIISTHYKSRTIIVMCKNGKSLKMVGTNLYGFINKPFTKIFIKNIQPKSL